MKACSLRLAMNGAVLALMALAIPAVANPPSEKEKIECLIHAVEGLKGAKFIRNGSEYDSAAAAKFLRRKWEAHAKSIVTARDFIDKAASSSSTSGQPYLIQFKDGKPVKCGEYLSEELKRLESQPAAGS